MDEKNLKYYWQDIPIGKENAVSYAVIMKDWIVSERQARQILHELSGYDNGDEYVLIRSARSKGFYKTDDINEIKAYKQECLNKSRSLTAPIKKINRILKEKRKELKVVNNMRKVRELKNLKQAEVVSRMQQYEKAIDKSMLSKMENGLCLPTPAQVTILAEIYDCEPQEVIDFEV